MSWNATPESERRASPQIAALLTWIVPGAGHLYLGRPMLALLGFLLLALGLFGHGQSTGQILALMGVGALLVFFGVALFSAQLVAPLATLVGRPLPGQVMKAGPRLRKFTIEGARRAVG